MATGVQDAGGGAMAKGSSTTASAPRRFGSLLSVLLIPFARRFIAGITLSEALEACAKLKAQGEACVSMTECATMDCTDSKCGPGFGSGLVQGMLCGH